VRGLVGALVGIPVAFLLVKHLWRRDRDWMRLGWDGRSLLRGGLLGLGAAGVVTAILVLVGVAHVQRVLPPPGLGSAGPALLGALGWSLFVALLEETVFRGMMTRELAMRWGWPAAGVVAGVVFSAVHLPAAGSKLTPLLAMSILLAGVAISVLLTALYVRTRSLTVAVGFHSGWNFALSGLLGTTMSGQDVLATPWRTVLTGHWLWTGGAFGLECSVASLAVVIGRAVAVISIGRRDAVFLPASGRTEP
jgi:uncharacterized protein